MDALTHAIEAYVDKEWSPASDALALHAITLISGNILQACAKPDDLQARGAMQVGSFLAASLFHTPWWEWCTASPMPSAVSITSPMGWPTPWFCRRSWPTTLRPGSTGMRISPLPWGFLFPR
jgi:hypothetical protein